MVTRQLGQRGGGRAPGRPWHSDGPHHSGGAGENGVCSFFRWRFSSFAAQQAKILERGKIWKNHGMVGLCWF